MEVFIERLNEEMKRIDFVIKELSKEKDTSLNSIMGQLQLIYSTPFSQTDEAKSVISTLRSQFIETLKEIMKDTGYTIRDSSDLMMYYHGVFLGYFNLKTNTFVGSKDMIAFRHNKKNNLKKLLQEKKDLETRIEVLKKELYQGGKSSSILAFRKKAEEEALKEELERLNNRYRRLNDNHIAMKEKFMNEINDLNNFEKDTSRLVSTLKQIDGVSISDKLLNDSFELKLFIQREVEKDNSLVSEWCYRHDDVFALEIVLGREMGDLIEHYNLESISINSHWVERLMSYEGDFEFTLQEAKFINEHLKEVTVNSREEYEGLENKDSFLTFSSATFGCKDNIENKVYALQIKDSGEIVIKGEFIDLLNLLSSKIIVDLVRGN